MLRRLIMTMAAMVASVGAASAAVTVVPSEDLSTLEVGDSFTIILTTSSDTDPYASLNINLAFNGDVISYLGAEFDPFFNFVTNDQRGGADELRGPVRIENITATTFNFNFVNPGQLERAGAGTLVVLTFVALAPGMTNIVIDGAGGLFLSNAQGQVAFDGMVFAEVNVMAGDAPTVVPLPAAAFLFLPALGALVVARRRR